MVMRDVVVVEAGRSAIGKRGGSFARSHPADVLGPVQMEVLRRAHVETSEVGQVVGGCINKVGAQAMNITRTAWLSHGGAKEIACTTVDSQCGATLSPAPTPGWGNLSPVRTTTTTSSSRSLRALSGSRRNMASPVR